MPRLARIRIFPIKSLDPLIVKDAIVLPGGALQNDRRFALVEAAGRFINGKRNPRVHLLRCSYDSDCSEVTLTAEHETRMFPLGGDRAPLESWLSDFFKQPVRVIENAEAGFPDDTDAPGPTVISEATHREVAAWFPQLTINEIRLRFRANLELADVEPFWEDQLYSEPGVPVRFRIGEVVLAGTNPCQRCVVPTRSPLTGEIFPGFAKSFEDRRFESLPYWATRSRFDHFYRLAVNTRIEPGRHGTIRAGDDVEIIDSH